MNYLVAVLRDRIQAEAVYTALERGHVPLAQVSILGKGYKSADEFGLINPNQTAKAAAILMSYWLVPFGFISGLGFSLITGLQTFAWAGEIGDHLIGGILGAIAGGMGSFFVGGGTAMSTGSGDALPYHNRLKEGKYLIIVKGASSLTNQATAIIKPFAPENLQGYTES